MQPGLLDLGQRVALATHLHACPRCREWVRDMERVGGVFLAEERALPRMAADALARTLARLDEPPPAAAPPAPETADAPAGLPGFVRRYHIRPLAVRRAARPHAPDPSARAGADARLSAEVRAEHALSSQHEHTALELTCVLTGAFHHGGGRYGPGDFDLGDDSVRHEP